MLSLEIYKKIPIPHIDNSMYTGIEKKGNHHYICNPCNCKIMEYNECFEQIECHQVKRGYTHISYCCHQECYFAITDEYNKIYKLNSCFEEEECYYVKTGYCMMFNGIDCKENILYLSCGYYIITISLDCPSEPEIWIKENECLNAVAKCSNYLLTSVPCCNGSSVAVYNHCKQLQLICCLPEHFQVKDITCDKDYIYILVSKCHCYNFVLVCQLHSHCHTDSCQACTDIIESIALIEKSLSQVLDAEGEKLKKIIGCSDDPEKILEANKAVNRTITNITHLELVLYSKLEAALNLCENEKK